MKFLLDTNPADIQRLIGLYPDYVAGQLICPVHSRSNWGGCSRWTTLHSLFLTGQRSFACRNEMPKQLTAADLLLAQTLSET